MTNNDETHTTHATDETQAECHWSQIDPLDPREPTLEWVRQLAQNQPNQND